MFLVLNKIRLFSNIAVCQVGLFVCFLHFNSRHLLFAKQKTQSTQVSSQNTCTHMHHHCAVSFCTMRRQIAASRMRVHAWDRFEISKRWTIASDRIHIDTFNRQRNKAKNKIKLKRGYLLENNQNHVALRSTHQARGRLHDSSRRETTRMRKASSGTYIELDTTIFIYFKKQSCLNRNYRQVVWTMLLRCSCCWRSKLEL